MTGDRTLYAEECPHGSAVTRHPQPPHHPQPTWSTPDLSTPAAPPAPSMNANLKFSNMKHENDSYGCLLFMTLGGLSLIRTASHSPGCFSSAPPCSAPTSPFLYVQCIRHLYFTCIQGLLSCGQANLFFYPTFNAAVCRPSAWYDDASPSHSSASAGDSRIAACRGC